ncbi:MAG: type I pullulanase, partial [Bacteroidota bacterium]
MNILKKEFLIILIAVTTMSLVSCQLSQKEQLTEGFPVYDGNDLGVTYSPERTKFRVWAPSADAITVRIYDQGNEGNLLETYQMEKDVKGTWLLELDGDWKNRYYTYQATIGDKLMLEVPDPYAKAVGVNGDRGMIVDLASTNPEGWEDVQRPPLESFADIV